MTQKWMKLKKNSYHDIYITTQELNKLMAVNFDAKLKWAKLATKGDIADFVKTKQIFSKN